MARGNGIIVTADPRGQFKEGLLSTSGYPGTVWEVDPSVALNNGEPTFKPFSPTTGKNPTGAVWVLREDHLLGKTATDQYASGARGFFYCPSPGDELNMLVKNLSGTADDHPLGERLMIDSGTGKLVVETGSPVSTPFLLLEVITDPTADTLAWVQYSGV